MADHNVEGQLAVLLNTWLSPEWSGLWTSLACGIESFERLGIPTTESDAALWELCQDQNIVLITGNRNADGHDSLEAVIRRSTAVDSLPVLTISDPDRIIRDRDYAARVATAVMDYLENIDFLRGTGRLFVP